MRPATALVSLLAAAMLVGCGSDSVRYPRPNSKGDTAFVAQLTKLCSATPPVTPISASARTTTITAAANADSATMSTLYSGLVSLTPTISDTSPLVPAVTDLAQLLLDLSRRYVRITNDATLNNTVSNPQDLRGDTALTVTRAKEARAELVKIGVNNCFK